MYDTALTSRSQVLRRNQNTTRFSIWRPGLGPISNVLFVALIVSVIGVMYLTQITKSSSYGYRVDELKTAKDQLISENEQLEIEAARLQALERIRNSDVARGLQSSENVQFTH